VLNFTPQLKALADPTRLQILAFLQEPIQSCCTRDEGVCACDLETFLGLTQPTVSHHMKQLVEAGLVTSEKGGRWVYYDLNPDAFQALIEVLQPYANPVSAERAVR
jgi:ArsR family transcriptional regulator, arsenate/arsenite/antimonite-responsive transcriptional repressor